MLVVNVATIVVATIKDKGFSIGKTFELGMQDVFIINKFVVLMFEVI